MIIIHIMTPGTLPRLMNDSLAEHMRLMPSTVVTGARQTGKSTLVRQLQSAERRYVTLDDTEVLSAARTEPELILSGPLPITIDEVQREPRLMLAIKREIDERRTAGRFSAHRVRQSAAHAGRLGDPGRTRQLPDPLADDAH